MVNTIIFDWGDTLMMNMPGASGPMADWPEVRAVAGAEQALAQLAAKYRLAMATNASDSSVRQVRKALARVKLDGYITAIYTVHELKAMKPNPVFYQKLDMHLGCQPHEAVMVGDSFGADILPAHQVGMLTVWYNPAERACHPLPPVQDDEVNDMALLPQVLAHREKPSGALPGVDQCLGWLQERALPPNIVAHSQRVAGAAYLLACWLRQSGVAVDPLLAHRGGLLHDLAKIPPAGSVIHQTNHGEGAARLLTTYGQPELAQMARRHMLFSLNDPEDAPQSWEEKLVYFADKLVEGSEIVPFEERLQALRRRYKMDDEQHPIREIVPALENLQAEICRALHIPPADLVPKLRSHLFKGV